jgi:tetratricopeptide (TPR) repeat protein
MRKTILASLIILITSCNSGNKSQIAELYKQANKARISAEKQKAILLYQQIVELDNESSDAIRVLSELYFETGNFEKSLELNKKSIELNPELYHYQAKMGLLLKLFDRKEESQIHYFKARELLKQKEEYYWTKTDTLSMASMFIEVGDSIRGRNLIDSIIKRKINNGFPEHILRELQNQTHGETIELLKSVMDSIQNSTK